MGRKIYIGVILIATLITTSMIFSFHPNKDSHGITEKYFNIIEKAANGIIDIVESFARDDVMDEGDFVINDEVLAKFMEHFCDNTIENLEIYEKEDAKYILESMGYYNTTRLKELLEKEPINKEEVYKLLHENLYEEQILKLQSTLSKK